MSQLIRFTFKLLPLVNYCMYVFNMWIKLLLLLLLKQSVKAESTNAGCSDSIPDSDRKYGNVILF